MGPAGYIPFSAGGSNRGMVEDIKRNTEEDRERFIGNGTHGKRSTHEGGTQKCPEKARDDSNPHRKDDTCAGVTGPLWKTSQDKEVASIDPQHRTSNMPGGISEPTLIQKEYEAYTFKSMSRMEDGPQRSGVFREGGTNKTTEGGNTRRSEESDEFGNRQNSSSSAGGRMGNGCKRQRYLESEDLRHHCRQEGNTCAIHNRQNSNSSTIHSEHNTNIRRNEELCTQQVCRREERLAIPGDNRRTPEKSPQKSGCRVGTEIAQEGSSPTSLCFRDEGLRPAAYQPTQVDRDAKALSSLRLAVRGEELPNSESKRPESDKKQEEKKKEEGGGGGRGGGRGRGGGDSFEEEEKIKKNSVDIRGMPRFVAKHFIDPPSWEEIQQCFPNIDSIQRKTLPLNTKRVGRGSIEKLKGLDSHSKECKEFLLEALRILWDSELYEKQTKDHKPKTIHKPSLSKSELNSLEDYKFVKATTHPTWGVFAFKVAEPHKSRCRCIFDCAVNRAFLATPKYNLKNKTTIRKEFIRNSEDWIFVQFDFRSFYDQFLLEFQVRKYFGFIGHDDMPYWLLLLPMGFRLAVAAAQATMWQFLNFKFSSGVNATTCIDNVCFSGPRAQVYETINIFLTRVMHCEFTLNGFENSNFLSMTEKEKHTMFKDLEEEEPEFLGEKYFFKQEKRCITEKTIKKLNVVWTVLKKELESKNQKKNCTCRQFFCLVGILVYCTEILDINTHYLFNVFKKIRNISSFLSTNEEKWDCGLTLHLSSNEYSMVEGWVNTILTNSPVQMTAGKKDIPPLNQMEAFIVVDASGWGWGALYFDENKKYKFFTNGAWPNDKYKSSVRAEPEGIECVVAKWKTHLKGKYVAIYTDHKNLVHASRAMFVHCYTYNKCLTYLRRIEREEGCKIFIFFLEGTKNTADGVSRGETVVEDSDLPLNVEGSGFSSACLLPWQI